ncbi:tetratricopeptide repeat protein [Verrucomicrobiota bacterium sgz303538]
MRPKYLPLILCASIALSIAPAHAQVVNDPSESFLSAFSAFQRAEKIESSGNGQAALAAYKEAARVLEQISARWPQWNPAIVEFRKKRTADAILKVQERMARGGDGTAIVPNDAIAGAGGGDIRGIEPELPGNEGLIPEPMPEPESRPSIAARPPAANSGASVSGNPIQQIQDEMNRLNGELTETKRILDGIRKEKEDLAHQLAESQAANQKGDQQVKIIKNRADIAEAALLKALSEGQKESETVKKLTIEAEKARKALKDAQIEREAAEDVRKQLADRLSGAQKRIATLTTERDSATRLSSDAANKIAEARKQMELAIKEKELLNEKLGKITHERDDALAQVAKMKESQKQVDRLISENTELMAKLEAAEKQITQFKADGIEKDKVITDLKKEVGTVKQQLADTQKQSEQYQLQMGELKTKLEATAQQLAQAHTDSAAGTTERKKMQDENDLLRGIVLRQMKEQARRDQTRKLVLDQMAKLEVKSKDLLGKIDYLGQPVVKLSDKERALFKKAQVDVNETEISISAVKQDAASEAAASGGEAPAIAANEAAPAAATEGTPADTQTPAVQGGISADLMQLVKEAKANFDHGSYREAEKTYEKILAKDPTNLNALTNIGVTRFRLGKLKQAEESLKKAIAIAPQDAFSRCTLGIVYSSQNKYDEAINELTAAIAINPKNAVAHNYLGVSASHKGWQDNALKELETATALDPNYAEAHFNLAVLLASQQPPNKEGGRRYYKRATELGAEPDAKLEAMLR